MKSFLIKRKNIFILAVIFFLLIIFSLPKTKYYISRLILSHELSILPNLVFKKLDRKINFDMYKIENQKKTAVILNEYVFEHTLPIEINLDDGASWKLLHGSIWCDGVSDILNRLLEVNNTRSYLVFLYADNDVSPHTLSFVDFLDQPLINGRNSSLEKETLYVFDPQNNYNPLNVRGEIVNISYMIQNKYEFKEMIKLDSDSVKLNLLSNNKAQLWDRNVFGSENSFIRNISKKLVKFLPDIITKQIIKFSIFINPNLDADYKKYIFARLEHVLINYDEALKRYQFLKQNKIYENEAKIFYERIIKFNS